MVIPAKRHLRASVEAWRVGRGRFCGRPLLEDAHSSAPFPSHLLHPSQQSLILAFASNVIDVHVRSVPTLAAIAVSTPSFRHSNTVNTRPNTKMFSKTVLLSALAALAAAQSTVLTFTNVPNPITDGEAQAITFATNDTSSVSTLLARSIANN